MRKPEFFRSLGLEANTDVTIQGVRMKHDLDVLAGPSFRIRGTWIVECKHGKQVRAALNIDRFGLHQQRTFTIRNCSI